MRDNPFIPHQPTGPQLKFLSLLCLDSLYGGAAGGGKSDALLMAALQFARVRDYSAIILRRTFADLRLPGALIDRSHRWLNGTGAKWNDQEHRWRFPSGASLQFGYAENARDVYRYDSSEYQFVGFDEATQFEEDQVRFMFGRLRRAGGIPVPLRFRLASNPGGPGHEFVKHRYGIGGDCPAGRAFVPARVDDNPHIDRDEYRRSLAELPALLRAQREDGDWDAVAGGRFRRETFRWYECRPGGLLRLGDRVFDPMKPGVLRFVTVDPASSEKETNDPSVIAAWAVTRDNELVWLDCVRAWLDLTRVPAAIRSVADRWDAREVLIEAVASNNGVFKITRTTGLPVRPVSPLGRDKLVRATAGIVLCDDGRVWFPRNAPGFPLDEVVGELVRFTGNDKVDAFDDVVDNLSYAAERLRGVPASGAVPGAGPTLKQR